MYNLIMEQDGKTGGHSDSFQLAQSLDDASIDEMKNWIGILKAEILRLEQEIEQKQANKIRAEAFFNK